MTLKPEHLSSGHTICKRTRGQSQSGQIIVEYVILLVIVVSASALLTRELVSRNPGSPGVLIQKWQSIITTIGEDFPD